MGSEEAPGIRLSSKSRRVRERVGWSHSTVDPGDNITSGKGRTPAVGAIQRRLGEAYWES